MALSFINNSKVCSSTTISQILFQVLIDQVCSLVCVTNHFFFQWHSRQSSENTFDGSQITHGSVYLWRAGEVTPN